MIAGMTYYQIAWYFLIYSFLGWVLEVVYHAAKNGRIINRGFLCGPVCPVYGFGALAVFALTKAALPAVAHIPERQLSSGTGIFDLLIVFLGGMLLATLVELFAGWLLNTLFHARWWDYSREPLNFHGYICLRFSLIWGLVIIVVVRVIQPIMEANTALHLQERIGWHLLLILYILYAADLVVTVMIVAGLNRRLKELDTLQKKMKKASDALSWRIGEDTIRTQQKADEAKVQGALARYELRDKLEEKKKELLATHPVFGPRRLLLAFPNLQHRDFQKILSEIRERWR